MTDWQKQWDQEEEVLEALAKRDFQFLTDLVRNDAEMVPEVRELLAEIFFNLLTGNWKRPARRPKSLAAQKRRKEIVGRVLALELDNWPTEAAVTKVAHEFRVSTRWVWKIRSERRLLEEIEKNAQTQASCFLSEKAEKDLGPTSLSWARAAFSARFHLP